MQKGDSGVSSCALNLGNRLEYEVVTGLTLVTLQQQYDSFGTADNERMRIALKVEEAKLAMIDANNIIVPAALQDDPFNGHLIFNVAANGAG